MGEVSDEELLKDIDLKTRERPIATLLVEETMQTLPTPEEALEALKSQPGIDLTKQKKGTSIIVETDSLLFEIVVLDPGQSVDRSREYGRRSCGSRRLASTFGASTSLDASVGIDNWIGRTMQMFHHFRNGDFSLTGPVVTASIAGPGWNYEVF